jgi:hypothetical protein
MVRTRTCAAGRQNPVERVHSQPAVTTHFYVANVLSAFVVLVWNQHCSQREPDYIWCRA